LPPDVSAGKKLLVVGSEAGVEIARAYRDEFAAKVRDRVAGVPGEQLRLFWFQNRIQFRAGVEELLEEGYGLRLRPGEQAEEGLARGLRELLRDPGRLRGMGEKAREAAAVLWGRM